jgi:hypothetical protein
LVIPAYSGQVTASSANGVVTVNKHATLLEVNGWWALIPLAIPVLIVLIPMIFPNRWVRVGAAVALACFVFITGLSIGLFYLPSLVTLFAATVLSPKSHAL